MFRQLLNEFRRRLGCKANREDGFSLIELLMSMGILSVVILGLVTMIESQNREAKKSEIRSSVLDTRNAITAMIASQVSWSKSIDNNNATMGCLKLSNCSPTSGGAFDLYDANGAPFVETSNPSTGFDKLGKRCNTFSDIQTETGCFFRVELSWRPGCDAADVATCLSPEEQVTMKFVFSKAAPAVNAADYTYIDKPRASLVGETPSSRCASRQAVFFGRNVTYRGIVADADGCVDLTVIQTITLISVALANSPAVDVEFRDDTFCNPACQYLRDPLNDDVRIAFLGANGDPMNSSTWDTSSGFLAQAGGTIDAAANFHFNTYGTFEARTFDGVTGTADPAALAAAVAASSPPAVDP